MGAGEHRECCWLALGLATNLWAYWYSDTMVLKLYNAREVDATSAPQLYATVKDLAGRAGLPMPRVYLIDEAQPNAFATGRSPEHAALAATTGILQLLTARELRGVLGHELAHVRNRDILTSTITASIAGAISTLAHFGMFFGRNDDDHRNPLLAILVLILAPIAALLIQLAISRGREYEADVRLETPAIRVCRCACENRRYAKGLPLKQPGASATGNDDHQSAARRRHRRVSARIPGRYPSTACALVR